MEKKLGLLPIIKKKIQITQQQLKHQIILKQINGFFFILMNRKKGNTFNQQFLRAFNSKLDIVQKSPNALALITCSTSHMFSGGMYLNYVAEIHPQDSGNFILQVKLLNQLCRLFGRLMAFQIPTIAAIQGTAFAGGFMLAMAHDWRIGTSSSTFCLNQIQIGLHLPPGMTAVVQHKVKDISIYRDICLLAKRFKGRQALQAGILDKMVDREQLIEKSLQFCEMIKNYSRNRKAFGRIKKQMNRVAIQACFNRQHALGLVGQIPQVLNLFKPKL